MGLSLAASEALLVSKTRAWFSFCCLVLKSTGDSLPLFVCWRFWVVEHFNVFEHVLPCIVASWVCAATYPFPFQQLEEAFCDRVVMTVPTAAHAGLQVVPGQEQLPLAAGELRSLIGMDHHHCLRFAPPDGRKLGLQRQVGRHAGLCGPADHAPREEINHNCQIKPALMGLDIGDVCHPDLVGPINCELPV